MRSIISLAFALALVLAAAPVALAAEGVATIHEEVVAAGPYSITVGFSRWPLNADRSLDILFTPAGGIEGLSGTVTLVSPAGVEETMPLARHPRMRSVWGLDVIALPEAGPWSLVFAIDGPGGPGVGRLAPLMLGERPGPGLALSWAVGLLPLIGLAGLVGVAWARVRPGRRPDTWRWDVGG
jgi:hypothetical protein